MGTGMPQELLCKFKSACLAVPLAVRPLWTAVRVVVREAL